MNTTDVLILAAGVAAAAWLLRKPTSTTALGAGGSSAGTGSPENLYSGVTAAQAERNRTELQRQLRGADFWV